jgi:hypothetical protein
VERLKQIPAPALPNVKKDDLRVIDFKPFLESCTHRSQEEAMGMLRELVLIADAAYMASGIKEASLSVDQKEAIQGAFLYWSLKCKRPASVSEELVEETIAKLEKGDEMVHSIQREFNMKRTQGIADYHLKSESSDALHKQPRTTTVHLRLEALGWYASGVKYFDKLEELLKSWPFHKAEARKDADEELIEGHKARMNVIENRSQIYAALKRPLEGDIMRSGFISPDVCSPLGSPARESWLYYELPYLNNYKVVSSQLQGEELKAAIMNHAEQNYKMTNDAEREQRNFYESLLEGFLFN